MLKRCLLVVVVLGLLGSVFVFGAGGTHSAAEVGGGTFKDVASYSVGTDSSDQLLTLYQSGATPTAVSGANKVSGGIGIVGSSTLDGTGVKGISVSGYGTYGTSDSGTGVVGTSASGYGVFGSSSAGYSGYFIGSKFQVLADGGNPSGGNCPAGSLWVDNNPANNAKDNGECYLVSLYTSSGGLVGMGTTSPGQKLDVVGYVKGTGLCMGSDCRTVWPVDTDTDNYVDSVSVTGTSTKTITVGRTGSLTDVTTTFTDIDTDTDNYVDSFSATGGTFTIGRTGTLTDLTAIESDPQVGTLTNAKWCTSDGSQVICNSDAPSGGVTSIIAGTGISISPVGGTGAVTVGIDTGVVPRKAEAESISGAWTYTDKLTIDLTGKAGSGGSGRDGFEIKANSGNTQADILVNKPKLEIWSTANNDVADLHVRKVILGSKWHLSGAAGTDNTNDEWLRFLGSNGNYYGGIAAGKVWAESNYNICYQLSCQSGGGGWSNSTGTTHFGDWSPAAGGEGGSVGCQGADLTQVRIRLYIC